MTSIGLCVVFPGLLGRSDLRIHAHMSEHVPPRADVCTAPFDRPPAPCDRPGAPVTSIGLCVVFSGLFPRPDLRICAPQPEHAPRPLIAPRRPVNALRTVRRISRFAWAIGLAHSCAHAGACPPPRADVCTAPFDCPRRPVNALRTVRRISRFAPPAGLAHTWHGVPGRLFPACSATWLRFSGVLVVLCCRLCHCRADSTFYSVACMPSGW